MAIRTYIGIVEQGGVESFGIYFPDFDGCVSAGATAQEAWDMGREALQFHIQGMLEDGEPIPYPTSLENIKIPEGCAAVCVPFCLTPVSIDPEIMVRILSVTDDVGHFILKALTSALTWAEMSKLSVDK